jgi:hypothetical protein
VDGDSIGFTYIDAKATTDAALRLGGIALL